MKMGNDLRQQAIASASPAERLAGMDIEEFLAGLAPEELVVLMEQIKAQLAKQSADQPRHRTGSDQR